MLKIKNIHKEYKTGDLVQKALDGVSLSFRKNEFVAILGPSGSGKTTLLNVIGGLDRYDTGDLIINGVSTKKYNDRDWDSYRNHTIGFVFQSYNLIPHQTVLSNVEIALTVSGVSKSERRQRAIDALTEVGLKDHLHKRPNQLSGGQMQRVAIARALVNNPDILLADEPTGALDSDTSVSVMNLLKEVAKDRLVIMVTHNPELAYEYCNRIVSFRDGKITNDTAPFEIEDDEVSIYKNFGKTSISFLTSLSLSFNNLKTKKGRTLLTAFAGSIGIIGIALILSFSTGVNTYIEDIQRETMASYPIVIEKESIDMSSLMGSGNGPRQTEDVTHDLDKVYSNSKDLEMVEKAASSIAKNNLTEFKNYLDDKDSEIHKYVGDNGIIYGFDAKFDIYTTDTNDELIYTDGNTVAYDNTYAKNLETLTSDATPGAKPPVNMSQGGVPTSSDILNASNASLDIFEELLPGSNDELVNDFIKDNYDLLYGQWPTSKDEVVIILDENNEISLPNLYALGFLPSDEYETIINDIEDGEDIEFDTHDFEYSDMLNKSFTLLTASDYYEEIDSDRFEYVGDNQSKFDDILNESGLKLKVSGIIKPVEDSDAATLTGTVGYTKALSDYVIEHSNDSAVVNAQIENENLNILNGISFKPEDDDKKVSDTKEYISNLPVSEKADLAGLFAQNDPSNAQSISSMSELQLSQMVDQSIDYLDDESLIEIYDNYISSGSYDDNMDTFGYSSYDAPSSISIYTDTFEDKEGLTLSIENYNSNASEENQIVYTDFVALMTSSLTTIIDVISYVLIAFVAVSLIVSSIMIGIITYISVLERTKEIGILRAIGASKRNITHIFSAENFIIGLLSGVIGIASAMIITIPINNIIHNLLGTNDVNAYLSIKSALILIILSVIITFVGGVIPSKKASKKDPVTALRTE